MAHLRWWAEKVGKAGILPADNTKLGIPERRYVTNESKARELGDRLDRITDPHVRISQRLQAAFGLWREESILTMLIVATVLPSGARGPRADVIEPFRLRHRSSAWCWMKPIGWQARDH
jgi:hypothetical protein